MAVYFNNIIGNEKLKKMLSSYIQNKTLPHAFIIEGHVGSGKKLIAKSIAASLSCKHHDSSDSIPCMSCINCEKIFSDVSPDVILLNSDSKTSISVSLIRELKNHTYMSSNELEYKAYIIDEADKMTVQAQNAFLKILEEPITNVIYFLLCENSQMLLPTIISRAPVIRTTPIEKKQVFDYLLKTQNSNSKEDLSIIASLSGGNIGKAIDYLNKSPEYIRISEIRDNVYSFLALQASNCKKDKYISFFSGLDNKTPYAIELLRFTYMAIRDIIAYKNDASSEFDFFINTDDILKYNKNIKIKHAKRTCLLIEETIQQLHLNQGSSSASSILLNFAIKTWSAKNI